MIRKSVFLVALLLATMFVPAAPPAVAAGNPAVSITKLTDAIPTTSAAPSTTPWFNKTYTVSYPGSGPAIISANPDGYIYVLDPFDRLQVLVAGKVVVDESFWASDCQTTTPQMFIPVDISSFLKAGQNQLTLKFLNHCSRRGSTSGYLVIGRSGTTAPYDPPSNSGAICGTAKFFGVRGSGEKRKDGEGYGKTILPLKNDLTAAAPGLKSDPINYPAIPVEVHLIPAAAKRYAAAYVKSVEAGVASLEDALNAYWKGCPTHYVILGGYSQGAEVVRNVFADLKPQQKSLVASVVLFGDPLFNPKDSSINKGNYTPGFEGIDLALYGDKARKIQRAWSQRFQDYCTYADPICNFNLLFVPPCYPTTTSPLCAHNRYVQRGWVDDSIAGVLSDLTLRHVLP
jgi:hypothetical protein